MRLTDGTTDSNHTYLPRFQASMRLLFLGERVVGSIDLVPIVIGTIRLFTLE